MNTKAATLATESAEVADVGRIAVVNALPVTLAQYEERLLQILVGAVRCNGIGIEKNSGGSRATRLRDHQRQLRSAGRDGARVLDIWPAAGAAEPLLLGRRHAGDAIVVHDPVSLRRAHGNALPALVASRLATALGVRVVVHSEAARRVLAAADPLVVAIPTARPSRLVRRPVAEPVVRVLGQWKVARDVRLLEALGPALRRQGIRAEIFGRGWPQIPGWSVVDGFLGESEFDALIDTSSALIVPYVRFWQSGVAVRAIERGCPSVGLGGAFLEELQGPVDWLVTPSAAASLNAWSAAVDAAVRAPQSSIWDIAESYHERALNDYAALRCAMLSANA